MNPDEIDRAVEQTKEKVKSAKEFMTRIEKIAEHEVLGSPMLSNLWRHAVTKSEAPLGGTHEGLPSSGPDLEDDKVASSLSSIISPQLVSMKLVKDFRFDADEIIVARIVKYECESKYESKLRAKDECGCRASKG